MKRTALSLVLGVTFLVLAPNAYADTPIDPSLQHSSKQSILAKLWELEKRKNAAILRFLRIKK